MSRFQEPHPATRTASVGGDRWDTERFFNETSSRREQTTTLPFRGREPDRAPRRSFHFADDEERRRETLRGAMVLRHDTDSESSTSPNLREDIRAKSPGRPRFADLPKRPTLLRRQSSLDTFDLAAHRRTHDYRRYDHQDYGPPITPVYAQTPPRKQSVSRGPRRNLDDVRVAEPDYYGDEEFRVMRDRTRDRSETPRGRRTSMRLHEEIVREKVEAPGSRRGKTRIPKTLLHPRILQHLAYPYEDEGEAILVLRALSQEHIHSIIQQSEIFKDQDEEAIVQKSRARETSRVRERSTVREKEHILVGTKGSSLAVERHRSISRPRNVSRPRPQPPPSSALVTRPRRRSSPIRFIAPEDLVNDVIQPRYRQRTDREIEAEIQALREEKRRLRGRESTPPPAPAQVTEVKKDYKGPSPRLIRALMMTLT
ncbi:hypothetical protein FQN57_002639 [Myotisia sp. PD_48]|nr:hypothetical protein FQN57_002639 [Myotisia sp. PD_48]